MAFGTVVSIFNNGFFPLLAGRALVGSQKPCADLYTLGAEGKNRTKD